MKTETHFFDAKRENSVFQTKLDLLKSDGEIISGFTVTFWDKVFECEISNSEDPPTLSVRRTSDEEKEIFRKRLIQKNGLLRRLFDEQLLFSPNRFSFAILPLYSNPILL